MGCDVLIEVDSCKASGFYIPHIYIEAVVELEYRDFYLFQDGSIETFEEFLLYCVRITASDVAAAEGHFRDCYIEIGSILQSGKTAKTC
jgi:hypothetical protein